MENQQTVRALIEEIEDRLRGVDGAVLQTGNALYGPRPEDNENGKDPRSDLRSALERINAKLSRIGSELDRINVGLGLSTIQAGQLAKSSLRG